MFINWSLPEYIAEGTVQLFMFACTDGGRSVYPNVFDV